MMKGDAGCKVLIDYAYLAKLTRISFTFNCSIYRKYY